MDDTEISPYITLTKVRSVKDCKLNRNMLKSERDKTK